MADPIVAPRGSTTGGRLIFIDQARALAIALMLFGHSMDRFLGEPWRSGDVWQGYQFFRGLSSTLFLVVSGFSFVIATFGHHADYLGWSPRLWGRVRRIALILFLGMLLQLWAPTLSASVAGFTPERWERFVRFDILQTIGIGLLALHLLVMLSRTGALFWKLAAALLLGVVWLGVMTYRPDVDAALPVELGAATNLYHGSRFPLVPYAAFLLLGAVVGYGFRVRRERGDEWKVIGLSSGFAAVLIVFDLLIRGTDLLFPYSPALPAMPGYTFARAGCALLILNGLYLLGRARVVLPRVAFVVSRDALTIYFVHLLLVYGSADLFPGLFPNMAEGMNPLQALAFIGGLAGAMFGLAWIIGLIRSAHPRLLAMARHAVLLTIVVAFVAWSELDLPRVALTLMLCSMVVMGVSRLVGSRDRPAESG